MKPYRQIIFDFDGVILDSMPVRDRGFEVVLAEYPARQVAQLMAYHRKNGGLSRYVKFRYFFENIRGEDITEARVVELAEQFSMVMRRELTQPALLISDTLAFIRAQQGQVPMHIASGSDQAELRYLCQQLDIASYFLSIHGSPTPKTELVGHILAENGYQSEDTVLIGDSINDWQAAEAHGVRFWGYNNSSLRTCGEGYLDSYSTLTTT